MIAGPKAKDALEQESEEAKSMTVGPQESNDVGKEQESGKATKEEPESGDKPEHLRRFGSGQSS